MLLRKPRVHAENFRREQRSLIAARPRANLHHHVLLIVGILREQQQLQVLFQLRLPRLKRRQLLLRHGANIGVALVQHRSRIGNPRLHLPVLAKLLHHRLEIPMLLRNLLILLVIAQHLRIGHLPA